MEKKSEKEKRKHEAVRVSDLIDAPMVRYSKELSEDITEEFGRREECARKENE